MACAGHLMPGAMAIGTPYDDPNYPFWGIIFSAVYGGTFYWGMDQVNVQRVLGARDLKQARAGAMFATLLEANSRLYFCAAGVYRLARFYPGRDPKMTFVTLLNELLADGNSWSGSGRPACVADRILLSVMNSVSTLAVLRFRTALSPARIQRKSAGVLLGRVSDRSVAALLGVLAV